MSTETKTGHTPMQWKLNEHENDYGDRSYSVDIGHRYCPESEHRANARLIAAAPDLLAALKPFAALVHEDGVDAPYPEEKWGPLLTAAAAAVAKAEGRE